MFTNKCINFVVLYKIELTIDKVDFNTYSENLGKHLKKKK